MFRFSLLHTVCLLILLSMLMGNVGATYIQENKNDPTIVILFMFFGLTLGIIVMQVLSIYGEAIPYTVVVFLLGVILSSAAQGDGAFSQSISDWVSIDAELMLFVFLPPLIFGEAMNLNWYHVKGGMLQSMILAGPGVIFGALVMGAITKVLLPYNWGWNLAMTFGSILSATDPVAVVALLKNANASPKLTILIVGAALLSDGTAMVMFTVFFNAFNGMHYNAGSVISYFLAACVGSVGVGIGFGLVTVRWLRSANRPLKEVDITIQIAVTICCAYLVFFASQYSLEISGVLACVGAGIVLAWLGPPIILSHETMHNVWGMMEWVLNTLIFLLAGLIIGHRVLRQVKAIDWVYLFLLYIILMAIRFVMVGLLYPWISTIGHKCTKQEAIFMSWAGLRGALGMTLALQVEKGGPKDQESETSRLMFFVGGIVALSLLINATTAQQLLIWLDLRGTDSPEKVIVMSQIKKKLRKKMEKVIEQMAKEFNFRPEDMDEVRNSCSLLSTGPVATEEEVRRERESEVDQLVRVASMSEMMPAILEEPWYNDTESTRQGPHKKRKSAPAPAPAAPTRASLHRSFSAGKRKNSSSFAHRSSSLLIQSRAAEISRRLSMSSRGLNPTLMHDLLGYVRAIFLEIVKVRYWNHIEGGKLPRLSHSAQFLLYSIEVGLDQVTDSEGTKDWVCVEEEITLTPWYLRILMFLEDYFPISHTLGRMEAVREKRAVYMLTSFIEAHQHAQKKIHAFIGNEDGDEEEEDVLQTPEEIRVIAESVEAVAKAEKLLTAMSSETLSAIRSKQAARIVLAKEAEMVKSMMQEGLITNSHAEEFLEEIGEDTARIEKERNMMYREQGKLRGQKRQAKKEEDQDVRQSLLNINRESAI